MVSFGDVTLGLALDTTTIDRQISSLGDYSKKFKDVSIKVGLDSRDSFNGLHEQIKALEAGIDIPISFGNAKQQSAQIRKEIEQELKDIPVSVKVTGIPVVEVRADTRRLERDINNAILRVQSDFGEMAIPVKLTGIAQQVAQLKRDVSAAIAPIQIRSTASSNPQSVGGIPEQQLSRVIKAIESGSKNITEEVKTNSKETKPIKGLMGNITQGFQQGIGYTYAKESISGVIRGMEKTFEKSISQVSEFVGQVGATVGKRAGGVVAKGLGIDGIIEDIGSTSSKIKAGLDSITEILSSDVVKQRAGEFENASGDLVESILTGAKDTREVFERVKDSFLGLALSPTDAVNLRRQKNIETTKKEVSTALNQVDRAAMSTAIAGKKGLILTSQGFTPEQDVRAQLLAKSVGQIAGEQQAVIPLKSESTTGVRHGFTDGPIKGVTAIAESFLKEGLLDKYSEDVVNAVAQIVAAREENPNIEITVVGHSRGGMLARDIVEASQRLGIQGVKGASLASPSFGVARPQNFTSIMGSGDVLRPFAGKKAVIAQGISGHQQADYFNSSSSVSPLLQGVLGGKTYTGTPSTKSFNVEDAIANGIAGTYLLYEKALKKPINQTIESATKVVQESVAAIEKTSDLVTGVASGEKELSDALIEVIPSTQKALQALASPFRIYKKVMLYDLMRKAQELSKSIEVPDIDPTQYKSVGFVTGGVMQDIDNPGGVGNTQSTKKTLQPIVPDTLLVDSFNPWSQKPEITNPLIKKLASPIDPQKGLMGMLPKDLAGGILNVNHQIRRILNQPQFTSALLPNIQGGYNPDAVPRLAQQIAYAKKYPMLPQVGFSFSGGAFSMEPATEAANKMGIPTKSVAIAAPLTGITGTASSEQFKSLIGSNDPLALGVYGKGVDQAQKGAGFKIGIEAAEKMLHMKPPEKLLTPPSNVKIIQGGGFAHGLAKTIGMKDAQVEIQEFLQDAISEIPDGLDFSRINVGSEMTLRVEQAILPMLEMLAEFKKSTIESLGEVSEEWVNALGTHPVNWAGYFEGQIPEIQASAGGAKGESKQTIEKAIKSINEIQLILRSLAGVKTGELSVKQVDIKLREIQGYLDDVFAVTPPSIATQERLANVSSVLNTDIDDEISNKSLAEVERIGSELQDGLTPMLEVLANFKQNIIDSIGSINDNYREAMSAQPLDWSGFLDFESSQLQRFEPNVQGSTRQDVEKSRKAITEISAIFKQFSGLKTGELSVKQVDIKLREIQGYLDDVFAVTPLSIATQERLANVSSVLNTDIDDEISSRSLTEVERIGSELQDGLTPMLEVLANFKQNIIDSVGNIREDFREAMSAQPLEWSGFLDFESSQLQRFEPNVQGAARQDVEKSRKAITEISAIFKQFSGLKTGEMSVKDADMGLKRIRELMSTAFKIAPNSPEINAKLSQISGVLDKDTNQAVSKFLETRLQSITEEVEKEVGAIAEVVDVFKFKQFDLELKDEDFIENTKIFKQNTEDWQSYLENVGNRINEITSSPFAVEGFGKDEQEMAKRLKTLANQIKVLAQVKDPNTIEDIRKSLGRVSPNLQDKLSPLQQPKFKGISNELLGQSAQSLGIEDAVQKTRNELIRSIIKKLGSPGAINEFVSRIQSGGVVAAPSPALVQESVAAIEEVAIAVQETAQEAVQSIADIAPNAIREGGESINIPTGLTDVYEESKGILDELVVPQLKEIMRVAGVDSISKKRDDLIKELISSRSAQELAELSQWVKSVTEQGKQGGFRKIKRPSQSSASEGISVKLGASVRKIEDLLKTVATQQGEVRRQTLVEIEKMVQETDLFVAKARQAKDITEKELNQLKGYKGALSQINNFDDIKAELTNNRSQTTGSTTQQRGGLNAGLLGGGGALAAIGAFGGGGGAAQAATASGAIAATAGATPLLPLLGVAGGGAAALMGVRALRPIIERRYPEIAKIFYKDIDEMVREGAGYLRSQFRQTRRTRQQPESPQDNQQLPTEFDVLPERVLTGANFSRQLKLEEVKAALASGTEKIKAELANAWNQVPAIIQSPLKRTFNVVKQFASAIVGMQIFNALNSQMQQIIPVSLDVARRFQVIERTIEFVAGSAIKGANALKFVNAEIDRTGIALEPGVKGYQQIASAARGTALESETQNIFSSISQASGVYGLSTEDTQGSILALSQVIGKGNVSLEELRGQLSERIPGAMGIAARAMKMTESELAALVSTGQLTASEFLPKFARQLSLETGGGVAGAANTSQASVNRLNNELLRFQKQVGDAIAPAQIATFDVMGKALELLAVHGATLTQIFLSMSIAAGGFVAHAMAGVIKSTLIGTGVFKLLGSAIAFVKTNLISMAATAASVFAAIEVIKIWVSVMSDGGKEIRQMTESSEKAFAAIYAGTENATTVTQNYAKSWWDIVGHIKDASDRIGKMPKPQWLEKLIGKPGKSFEEGLAARRESFMQNPIGRVIVRANDAFQSSSIGQGLSNAKLFSAGEKAQQDMTVALGDQIASMQNGLIARTLEVIRQNTSGRGPIEEFNKLSEQLQLKQLKMAGLQIDPTGNKEALEQTKAEIQQIQDALKVPEKEISGLQGVFEMSIKDLQKAQAGFDPNSIEFSQAGGQIEYLEKLRDRFSELTEQSAATQTLKEFAYALRELNIVMAESAEKSQVFETMAGMQASRDAIANFSTDQFSSRRLAATQRSIQVASLKGQIPEQQAVLERAKAAISQPQYKTVLDAAGITDETSVARIRGMLQNIPESNKNLRNALDALAQMREAEQKLGQTRAQLANAEYQDLIGREQDFIENITRQVAGLGLSRQTATNEAAIAVSDARMGGGYFESELNAITARNTLYDTQDQLADVEAQLATFRKAFEGGLIGLETFSQKERELLGQSSDLSRQVADQKVAAWQAGNQEIIQATEREAVAVEHSIRRQQSARVTQVKQLQLTGMTAEEAAIAIGEAESEATQLRVTELEYLLSQNDEMVAKRIRTREEGIQREIQLEQQLDDAIAQFTDKQIQLRDLANQQAIRMAEDRAATIESAIRAEARQGSMGIKQLQVGGSLNSESAGIRQIKNELDIIPKRIEEITRKIAENKQFVADRVRTVREGAQIERQLQEELGGLEEQALDKQIQLREKERDIIRQTRETRANQAVESLEQQRRENDLAAQSLDLTRQLAESRGNLAKAQRDYGKAQLGIGQAETQSSIERVARSRELLSKLAEAPGATDFRKSLAEMPAQLANAIAPFNPMEIIAKQLGSFGVGVNISQFEKLGAEQKRDAILIAELQLLQQQQALETQMAAQKRESILYDTQAMQAEHQLALTMLEIDQERQRMTAKTAEFEAEIAIARAEQAQLTAEMNLLEQSRGGDPRQIAIAQRQYDIAGRGIALAEAQAEIARNSAGAQDELFGNAQGALQLQQAAQMTQQQIALYQHDGAEALRQQSAEMARADVAARAIAKSTETTAQSAERVTSAWGKAKEIANSIKPENLPSAEELKLVREGALQGRLNKTIDRDQYNDVVRATYSLEQARKAPKDKQQRIISDLLQVGNNPALYDALGMAQPVEEGKNKQAQISRRTLPNGVITTSPITASPLIPNAPINAPTTQAQTPAIAQAGTDPVFNELNAKVGQLLETVQQMDLATGSEKLNNAADKLLNAASRPTVGQLYVTSPEPITDAAKIMSDFSSQRMTGEGL